MSALVDLPEIEFVDPDVERYANNMITVVEGILGRKLYPGDPLRLFLLSEAALKVQMLAAINQVAKSNYLRYARGTVLDHMGAFTETPRMPATYATTTLRVTLSAAQPTVIPIPIGTRVSNEGDPKVYFETTELVEIPVGILTANVPARAVQPGASGNGFLPGQLNQIVDPLPFVKSIVNITESAGGADVESDDAYRQRIRQAPESFSVAGPTGAYEYWAKSANSAIVDVSVTSPAPTEVLIVPLLAGGEIPGQEVLDAVRTAVSADNRRPLTDLVTVAAPTVVNYDVTLTYWINRDSSADAVAIQAAVTQAINDFVLWQKSKLGRAVNPSELIGRIMRAGAYRVEVTSPVYTAVGDTSVAIAGTITATYGGLVDD